MKTIKLIIPLIAMALFTACNNDKKDTTFVGGENNTEVGSGKKVSSKSNIVLTVDGNKISIDKINQQKSTLQFYTAESDIKQDGDMTIKADNDDKLVVVIAGLQGKGVDALSGSTDITKNNSTIAVEARGNEYRFMQGTLNVTECTKATGKVKLTVQGKCMVIVDGKILPTTRKDLRDATLQVETTISNVRTINFQKSK